MDIDFNTHCYTFKKLSYNKGFLDKSVDATYVIHLKDNGRLEHIYEQLKQYQPTKIVYIAVNQGFKKCEKQLIEQISYNDLTDAFLQCFKHANNHGYENVLILEDDFIFSPEIVVRENSQNINNFLNSKKKEEFIYYLGCNPILVFPCTYNCTQYKVLKCCSTHATVYSKATRYAKLDLNLKHWDVIISTGISNKYMYYKPVCYQTYPDTENKQTWSEKDNIIISSLKNMIIQLLGLDKQPEPGFSILYFIAKLLNLVLLLILILIIVWIIHTVFVGVNNKNTNNKTFSKGKYKYTKKR